MCAEADAAPRLQMSSNADSCTNNKEKTVCRAFSSRRAMRIKLSSERVEGTNERSGEENATLRDSRMSGLLSSGLAHNKLTQQLK